MLIFNHGLIWPHLSLAQPAFSDRSNTVPVPLYECGIVSVHSNNCSCMEICDTVRKHLSMLIYIYLNIDES